MAMVLAARIRQQLSRLIRDLGGLAAEADLLQRVGVEELIQVAYARIAAQLLPFVGETAVCIMAGDPADTWLRDRMDGVAGSGAGDNTRLTINSTAPNWRLRVSYVLAHEHHPAVWGYNHSAIRRRDGPARRGRAGDAGRRRLPRRTQGVVTLGEGI